VANNLIPGGSKGKHKGPRYVVLPYGKDEAWVGDRGARGVSETYSRADAEACAAWLNDRWAGYASLRRFEGGANWPEGDHA